jgi:hypothetical protein
LFEDASEIKEILSSSSSSGNTLLHKYYFRPFSMACEGVDGFAIVDGELWFFAFVLSPFSSISSPLSSSSAPSLRVPTKSITRIRNLFLTYASGKEKISKETGDGHWSQLECKFVWVFPRVVVEELASDLKPFCNDVDDGEDEYNVEVGVEQWVMGLGDDDVWV